jgi:hypothetical protein
MAVGGSGVGNGGTVPFETTTVLTSAVITMGVETPLPPPAAGVEKEEHADRNTTKSIKHAINFFMGASFYPTTCTESILFPLQTVSRMHINRE